MESWLLPVNTTDKLRSVIVPTTRVGGPTNGYNWFQSRHGIEEATADRVSKTKANNNYNFKCDFETRREIQDCAQENISMSRPTLDSIPIGTNKTNRTTSPIGSIPVGTKSPDPTPLTRPTELPEQNGKAHVPNDPHPDPSLLESSSNKKKRDNKKERREHKKDDLSDPSSSENSDFPYDSDYRRKQRKRKRNQKTDPIKLCACLTAKLLTTVYKSKIIRFKRYEDPLHSRVYFLTFVELLEIIFSQYTETCEVILD